MLRYDSISEEEDRQILVDNEETPAIENNDELYAGGFLDAGGSNQQFIPATLPAAPDIYPDLPDQYQNVELQSHIQITDAPPDKWNYTYLVFYLLGMGTMTPWNFFVTAEDYWMYKFRNTTINNSTEPIELTPMQKSFSCDLTLTASISGTTFLILNAIYGHKFSMRLKMFGTLGVILVIFIITTAFVEVNTDKWQEQFFLITLFTVVIINVCSAILGGNVLGFCGLFPSQYMTAVVSGQALIGIFTALTLIMILAFGAGPNMTAFIYFIIGGALILLNIVSYAIMERRKFFKYYVEGGDKFKVIYDGPTHSRTVDKGVTLEPNIRIIMGKIFVEAVAACMLYATTLSVYPSVTVLMQSQNYGSGSPWSDVYYLPVVNYLFFNSGDYFGRILAGIFERPRQNSHTVLLMVFLRVLFVPFFLCSNSTLHNFLPILVHSDTAFMIMMMMFALTNGYLTNILLIMAPRSVMQHEKEMASSIMAATISLGLVLGSVISMAFVQMI